MSTSDETSDAELAAAAWVVRLGEPDVSEVEHAAFARWIAADPTHKQAYEALAGTWRHLDVLHDPPPRRRVSARVWAGGVGVALAACVALFVVFGPAAERPTGIDYASERAASQHIALEDGSRIELAPASLIEVTFTDAQRLVRLTQGAALFDVSPDPERPFVVATRFGEVRVRGTEFAVHVNGERARATVLHGRVEGLRPGGLFSPAASVLAQANEEIVLSADGAALQPASAVDVEHRLAWRRGMLALDGETLREACEEVTRVSGVAFAFETSDLAELRLNGFVETSDADAFTDIVSESLGLEAVRVSPNLVRFRARLQN